MPPSCANYKHEGRAAPEQVARPESLHVAARLAAQKEADT